MGLRRAGEEPARAGAAGQVEEAEPPQEAARVLQAGARVAETGVEVEAEPQQEGVRRPGPQAAEGVQEPVRAERPMQLPEPPAGE